MSRRIMVWIPDEHYLQLKDLSSAYQVSLSALAGSMIAEKLSGKQSFEERTEERLSDFSKRLGKMAYRLAKTEILLDEFLTSYLFYTPEVPWDFPGRDALHQSAKNRHKAILFMVQERLKSKEDVFPEVEEEQKNSSS